MKKSNHCVKVVNEKGVYFYESIEVACKDNNKPFDEVNKYFNDNPEMNDYSYSFDFIIYKYVNKAIALQLCSKKVCEKYEKRMDFNSQIELNKAMASLDSLIAIY